MTNPAPHVSVVIPTKNAERSLERCLESLQRQTLRPFETIVVDNFSTDQTVAIAERRDVKVASRVGRAQAGAKRHTANIEGG